MSNTKFMDLARMLTTYSFEIRELPDNLKCAWCKPVLKDACQVPCGCTFCRVCIDDMMTRGGEFCPGVSEDCGRSPLSLFSSDYRANNSVSRLIIECPHDGCVHECQLAVMEEHLRKCRRKNVECSFRESGCKQDKLAAKESHENRKHNEILIEMIANINREIETMKQSGEDSRIEIERLKHELMLKDEQIMTIMDRLINVENENKSIAQEKADLAGRVAILSEKLEREITERRENDELDMARVIEHVDREIATITSLIGSNDEFGEEIKSMKNDMKSINKGSKSIKDKTSSLTSQIRSLQELIGSKQVDAKCDWLIIEDLENTIWGGPKIKESDHFSGTEHPYRFQLSSCNLKIAQYSLFVYLRIHPDGSNEARHLVWPFEGQVIITVADRDKRQACISACRQCRIEAPPATKYSFSERFEFCHSEMIGAGLDLRRGVRILCEIVPDVGRLHSAGALSEMSIVY